MAEIMDSGLGVDGQDHPFHRGGKGRTGSKIGCECDHVDQPPSWKDQVEAGIEPRCLFQFLDANLSIANVLLGVIASAMNLQGDAP